jgi:hypothetical protein
MIFDQERRQIVVDWIESREAAEARLAELIEKEPEAEGILVILATLGDA